MVNHVANGGDGVYDISLNSSSEKELLSTEDQKTSFIAGGELQNFDDECAQMKTGREISACLLRMSRGRSDRDRLKYLVSHLKNPHFEVEYYNNYGEKKTAPILSVTAFHLKDPEILALLLKKKGAGLNGMWQQGCASGTFLDLVEHELPSHSQLAKVIRENGGYHGRDVGVPYRRFSYCSVQ